MAWPDYEFWSLFLVCRDFQAILLTIYRGPDLWCTLESLYCLLELLVAEGRRRMIHTHTFEFFGPSFSPMVQEWVPYGCYEFFAPFLAL